MPVLTLQDFKIISPSPDNFILRLSIDGKDYNYIGSGEHIYEDLSGEAKPYIHRSLITDQLAHSSKFEHDQISTVVTAWDIFDLNDVGVTTDADDENNDNLLLLQNSNIDPSAKTAIPMHQINSNSVYGFVSAITEKSIGVPKVENKDTKIFDLSNHTSDPITRYRYRPMAVALSSVLGLGTQVDFVDTFDKLFVFDPTDNNRLQFNGSLRNWRGRYQSNRDKSSYRVTNNFDFGKLLVRTVLFPKATLNNEYSTERRYTEVSSPYAYMRKYAWDDYHFYSNGSFIVLNSREDNAFQKEKIDLSAKSGTMVTSKYSRRFGDVEAQLNEVQPPTPPEVRISAENNKIVTVKTDYNKVDTLSAERSDIFENGSTFKQYMPESINRENETASDTTLMTSRHKANIFDVDIKTFWDSLKTSIGSTPSEVKSNIKDMVKKNLYEMIEKIRPAHTKLYKVITNDESDDVDASMPVGPTPVPIKKVKLTFRANGGLYNDTKEVTSITGVVGDPIEDGDIPVPTRIGYKFNLYDPEIPEVYPSTYSSYDSLWIPISYTIVFHSNIEGQEEITASQEFNYDESQNLRLNDFEYDYHIFNGWSETPDGDAKYQNGTSIVNLTTTDNATIDLYAVWTPESYIVTFSANGGTGDQMNEQRFTYGVPQHLSENTYRKDHYSFDYWTDENGNQYEDGDEVSLTSNLNLLANWKRKTYYVYFDGDEPTSGGPMERQAFIYGETQSLTKNTFVKTHYTFDGWVDADKKPYQDEEPISIANDLYLYASWIADNYEIRFHSYEGCHETMDPQVFTYNQNPIILKANEFTKRHYKFANWIDVNNNQYEDRQALYDLDGDFDLTATWEPSSYKVSFNKNDDEAYGDMQDQTLFYDDPDSRLSEVGFAKEHFDFINWIDINDIEYVDQQEMSDYDGDDLELSAQWAPSKYYVDFDPNVEISSEVSGEMERQEFTYGIPQRLYQNHFERSHYNFNGWIDISGNTYDDGQEIDLSSDLYLLANWSRISSTLTFYMYVPKTKVTYRNGTIEEYEIIGELGENSISNKIDIVNVEIAPTVTSIGSSAFLTCYNLSSITIPNSVSNIGMNAFSDCSSLTSISIPDTTTNIGDYAFAGCSSLSSITIPDGITAIGICEFLNCSNLTSITIPNSVEIINQQAFDSCTNLSSITLPNSVSNIGKWAFLSCLSLKSITIPDSVASIGNEAFKYCTSLSSIVCQSTTAPTLDSNVFGTDDSNYTGRNTYDTGNNTLVVIRGSTGYDSDQWLDPLQNQNKCGFIISEFIPREQLTIVKYRDGNSIVSAEYDIVGELGSLSIPSGVRENAIEVKIGTVVASIGDDAFYNCMGLSSIFIPNGVTSIGDGAFRSCYALTSIDIPDSVTSIADHAFAACRKLRSIIIPTAVPTIETSTFFGCQELSSVTIPNSVTSIKNQAFENCSKLSSITIPSGVSSISDYAFVGCSSLSSIECLMTIAPSVQSNTFGTGSSNYTGRNTFSTGNNVLKVPEGAAGYETIGIAWKDTLLDSTKCGFSIEHLSNPNTVVTYQGGTVQDFAISGELEEDSIPNKENAIDIKIGTLVDRIGEYALSGCTLLTSVTLPDNLTNIKTDAFRDCTSLSSIDIPNNVLGIAGNVFYGCTSLESITIPSSVTWLGGYSFVNCTSLTSITIGSRISSIENRTFFGCTSLSSITIPSNVTNIGEMAFYYCTNLSSIECYTAIAPNVQSDTFGDPEDISSYTGRDTYDTGDNILKVPENAIGYDSSEWANTLQDPNKCGFTIEYSLPPIALANEEDEEEESEMMNSAPPPQIEPQNLSLNFEPMQMINMVPQDQSSQSQITMIYL